ncbi:low density lipoprotein receptor adapter protein 1-A-like [Corticium candelabrum]|uniref:low density lipoprotein receptor adapter protein 1-A-like n=1 Tax=Corticium candelabrum TaxID=121492 RepID=UPI002E2757D9|nr:low density lipoprotein receptor adapter protein 1-A-like [Corticium candelabrum]
MEALRTAARAVKNSPSLVRKKLGGKKHEKLEDDWLNSRDAVTAGVTFYVKYLGSSPVSKACGTGCTDEAVRKIIHHARARAIKLQKMSLTVSAKSIKLLDMTTQTRVDELPIYRVSYCTADENYDKVFCYISKDSENGKLECHAFLCTKRSKAQAMCLTVAQAFNIAYENWQEAKQRRAAQKAALEVEKQRMKQSQDNDKQESQPVPNVAASGHSTDTPVDIARRFSDFNFDDEDSAFDAEFSKLAEVRSNPNVLDIGIADFEVGDDVKAFRGGELSAADINKGRSHEDLLDI